MKRTRVYASRSRSSSRQRKKGKAVVYPFKVPRAPALSRPMVAAIGETQRIKMIYADFVTTNPNVTGTGGKVYGANALYDPEIAVGGHSANGFDEYKLLYERMTVIASRIKVSLSPQANAEANPALTWGVMLVNGSPNISNDCREYIENGEGKWLKLTAGQVDSQTIICKADISKHVGDDVLQRAEFDNTPTANPQNVVYWHIWVQTDAQTDTGAIYFTVEIDYDVLLRKNRLVPLSGI